MLTSVNMPMARQRLLHTAGTGVALLKDSEVVDGLTTRMMRGFLDALKPDAWGWVGNSAVMALPGGNTTGVCGYVSNSPPGTTGAGVRGFGAAIGGVGGTPSGGAGEANVWVCQFMDSGTFDGDASNFLDLVETAYPAANRASMTPSNWFDGAGTVDYLFYSGTLGWRGNFLFESHRPVPPGTQQHQDYHSLAAGGYIKISIPIGSGAGTIGAAILAALNENETGKNFYLLGQKWRLNSGVGLGLVSFGVGGASIANHLDTARVSQTAINNAVSMYGIDTVIFFGSEHDDPNDATLQATYEAVWQRYRTAILANGGRPFAIWITGHESANHDTAAIERLAVIHRNLALADTTERAWYGLGQELGPLADIVAAGYLDVDNIHTSALGAQVMAGMFQSALLSGPPRKLLRVDRADRTNRVGLGA